MRVSLAFAIALAVLVMLAACKRGADHDHDQDDHEKTLYVQYGDCQDFKNLKRHNIDSSKVVDDCDTEWSVENIDPAEIAFGNTDTDEQHKKRHDKLTFVQKDNLDFTYCVRPNDTSQPANNEPTDPSCTFPKKPTAQAGCNLFPFGKDASIQDPDALKPDKKHVVEFIAPVSNTECKYKLTFFVKGQPPIDPHIVIGSGGTKVSGK